MNHDSPYATRAATLLLAVALDWLAGEPPTRFHPVVWLGRGIQLAEQHAPRNAPVRELLYGTGMIVIAVGAVSIPAAVLEHLLMRWISIMKGNGQVQRIVIAALLLKPAFAWRTLHQAGGRVQQALASDNLPLARQHLTWLVSRPTDTLDHSLIAAAAIESLAENASDSVTAPLLCYCIGGLPAVWAYRAVNTLDAMIGYRGRYEFLGKLPARLDDLLNLLPARCTALLIIGAAALTRQHAPHAWRIMRAEHQRTASPNAGYPMSALAGALDVRLEKVDHYTLNPQGQPPTVEHLRRANQLIALALAVLVALIAWGLRQAGQPAQQPHGASRD